MKLTSHREAGFTLVETLVAMVVISVGMLGIAGLYVEGLRAGRTSIYRTVAIDLASDMADRIRANPTAGAAYNGAGPGVASACVNEAANFTAAALAADDTFCWHQDLQVRLPGAAANVVFAAGAPGAPNTYTITVTWLEPGVNGPLDYSLRVQI